MKRRIQLRSVAERIANIESSIVRLQFEKALLEDQGAERPYVMRRSRPAVRRRDLWVTGPRS